MSDPRTILAAPVAAVPIAAAPIAFVMLPGAGPACEGDDCLPSVGLDV